MKKLIIIALAFIYHLPVDAQSQKTNKTTTTTANANVALPDLYDWILDVQSNAGLFLANMDNNSKQRDVNNIIKDMQRYMDSTGAPKTRADVLLHKNYTPLRSYFLTTTNKTAVATNFLYADAPYSYATYKNELSLYIGAIKCGELYNLGRKTERTVIKTALNNCLLPSLKAMEEFKDTDVKHIGLSVYYGARDSREGASMSIMPYCLTLVAPLEDIQQYAVGNMTAKGLLEKGELYLSNGENYNMLTRIYIQVDEDNEVAEVIELSPKNEPVRRTTIIGPLPDGSTILEVR